MHRNDRAQADGAIVAKYDHLVVGCGELLADFHWRFYLLEK